MRLRTDPKKGDSTKMAKELEIALKKWDDECRKRAELEKIITKSIEDKEQVMKENQEKCRKLQEYEILLQKFVLWFDAQNIQKPPFFQVFLYKKKNNIEDKVRSNSLLRGFGVFNGQEEAKQAREIPNNLPLSSPLDKTQVTSQKTGAAALNKEGPDCTKKLNDSRFIMFL